MSNWFKIFYMSKQATPKAPPSWEQAAQFRRDSERWRQQKDDDFRQRAGTTPARGWIQEEVWNGGGRQPTPAGQQVFNHQTGQLVTPTINGMPPADAINQSRRNFERKVQMDRELGVVPKFQSRGYNYNQAPRTDYVGQTRVNARVTAEDRRIWQEDLENQQFLQREIEELRSRSNPLESEELNRLEQQHQSRFGSLSQAEMKVRGTVIPGYVDANRDIYSRRFQNPRPAVATASRYNVPENVLQGWEKDFKDQLDMQARGAKYGKR